MIRKHNTISLLLGVPGLILQLIGNISVMAAAPENMEPPTEANMTGLMGLAMLVVGTGMLIAGLAFYARSKARDWAWAVVGILGLIGIIVLACLKDRSGVSLDSA